MSSKQVRWIPPLVALLVAPAAAAQYGGSSGYGAEQEGGFPLAIARRPLTLPRHALEIAVPAHADVVGGHVATMHLNPAVRFGVTDWFTLGIRRALGFCANGDTDGGEGCPHVYNDIGVDAIFRLAHARNFDLATGVAVNAAPVTDPTAISGELRLVARYGVSWYALVLEPTINHGWTHRDDGEKIAAVSFPLATYPFGTFRRVEGNREFYLLPATAILQPHRTVAVAGGIAVDGPLNPPTGRASDLRQIPVGVAVVYTPVALLDLGYSLTYPNLVGHDRTATARTLSLFVALRP